MSLQIHVTERSRSAVEEGIVCAAGFRFGNLDTMFCIVCVYRSAVKSCMLQTTCNVQPRICSIPVADEAFVVHIEDNTSFNWYSHVEDDISVCLVLKEELGECLEHLIVGVMSLAHVYHLRQYIGFHPRIDLSFNGASGVESFHFPTILIDDSTDCECLSPKSVSFAVLRKDFVCHFDFSSYCIIKYFFGIRYT